VSSGWSVVLSDSLSGKTRMQSASVREQVCLSRICPDVDTRAYPDQYAASVMRRHPQQTVTRLRGRSGTQRRRGARRPDRVQATASHNGDMVETTESHP